MDKSGPSRKAIIGWLGVMLAGLGLAYFIGAVVVPVLQVRMAVKRHETNHEPEKVIAQLGGPKRAAVRLSFYLRAPKLLTSSRGFAAVALVRCGAEALPELPKVHWDNDTVNWNVMDTLGMAGYQDPRIVPPLVAGLGSKSLTVRLAAVAALAEMENEHAIAPLKEALRNDSPEVRKAAAEALEKIKAPSTSSGQGAQEKK